MYLLNPKAFFLNGFFSIFSICCHVSLKCMFNGRKATEITKPLYLQPIGPPKTFDWVLKTKKTRTIDNRKKFYQIIFFQNNLIKSMSLHKVYQIIFISFYQLYFINFISSTSFNQFHFINLHFINFTCDQSTFDQFTFDQFTFDQFTFDQFTYIFFVYILSIHILLIYHFINYILKKLYTLELFSSKFSHSIFHLVWILRSKRLETAQNAQLAKMRPYFSKIS